jgi:hypothetical protein
MPQMIAKISPAGQFEFLGKSEKTESFFTRRHEAAKGEFYKAGCTRNPIEPQMDEYRMIRLRSPRAAAES